MADRVMIATLYSFEPIIKGVIKLGASELFLIVDKKPNKEQQTAMRKVTDQLGDIVKIKFVPTEVYDIYDVAKSCVFLIDNIDSAKKITLNVSGARKTKAFALLYAGYLRPNKISNIVYVTKETGEVIFLPILSMQLSKVEKEILQYISQNKDILVYNIIKFTGGSRAKVYRTIAKLRLKGYIDQNTVELTVAGKIALL
jgi:CRISPR locus-related DNA-binding protein